MSAYAATGRIGQISLDEMGALAQMARQSTGSPEQTTTAIEALIRNFNDRTPSENAFFGRHQTV